MFCARGWINKGCPVPTAVGVIPVYASTDLFGFGVLSSSCNTRYEWLVRSCSAGTLTLQEAPSFAWRTNIRVDRGRERQPSYDEKFSSRPRSNNVLGSTPAREQNPFVFTFREIAQIPFLFLTLGSMLPRFPHRVCLIRIALAASPY
jgi:hypothetical protein